MLNVAKPDPSIKESDTATLFSVAHVAEARRALAWFNDRIGRAEHEVFSEVIELTPVLAELLLSKNESNRVPREGKVADFSIDISNGDWNLNGEPLIISKEGLLNDGQHRCSAVVRAGRSIRTVVTFGVDRASRLTVDQGASRSSGDYLAMDGVEHAHIAAAVSMYLWQYEKLGKVSRAGGDRPTKSQIRSSFSDHPDILRSIQALPRSGKNIARSQSVLAFCHYVFARKNRIDADFFIMRLMLGDGLNRRDPIYLCRERLITDGRMRLEEKVELIFRAWNASRQKKSLSKLQLMGTLPAVER